MDKLSSYVPRGLDTDLRTKIPVAGQRARAVLLKERARDEGAHIEGDAVRPTSAMLHPASSYRPETNVDHLRLINSIPVE